MPAVSTDVWIPAKPDPRTVNYPLMESVWPTAIITLIYVAMSYFWRKALVRQRAVNPEQARRPTGAALQNIIILYNVAMVGYSAYVFLETVIAWSHSDLGLGCTQQAGRRFSPNDLRIARIGWYFYFSKNVELLDTLFFLLKGKVDQVSFLHVFHHAAMPLSCWLGVKYSPAGVLIIFPAINSWIHVLMYAYYGLAAAGAYKYLWWKEYLTIAQMVQFMIMTIHQSQIYWPQNTCQDPKAFPTAVMGYSMIFLVLFANFYIKAYWKKQRLAKVASNGVKKAN